MNGFTLYIKDVLERPIFRRAKLMAGAKGMDRQVGWVHIVEITHVSPYVTRNDLILSTGLWLRDEQQERISYMQQLINQQAAGLCVELGTSIERIPKDLIDLAEKNDFPLIVFDRPVRFVEITQDIHGLLINQQHQLLKDLETFSRRLQQITLQSTDIGAILHVLYEYTGQQIVYYSSIESNKFHPRLSAEASDPIVSFFKGQVEGSARAAAEAVTFAMPEERCLLSQPVICLGQTLAYVGLILPERNQADTAKLLLDYAARSLASLLLRMLFLEEKKLRDQNQLIMDIIQQQVEDEAEARGRMGLRLAKKHAISCIAGIVEAEYADGLVQDRDRIETDLQDLLVQLRALLRKHDLPNLLMMKDQRIYVLCAREKAQGDVLLHMNNAISSIIERLKEAERQTSFGLRLHAGFGKIRPNMIDMHISFREAEQVLDVSRAVDSMGGVILYDQLGIYRLIQAISDKEVLTSFIKDHLGLLLAFDQEHHLHLIQTLKVYLQSMGSKNDTAKALFIHRQTLYNRLDKLTEILGDDYLEPQRRICLEMALLAHSMRSYDTMK
ncbi:PucR family transcriptional regulator [Paenibacillus pini]|uniref:Regulator of polyketide synthase expression n=1 Tax=Paenibacillus pini JCM 16418 TaxID=1236976 RepID=W7YGM6_9BACL|nr:PucR family transcriptional regulator [Paenibacillus pini]GAF10075.1 regulator of polyketide synthase expression [Paenibacillus pini JCM 16418]